MDETSERFPDSLWERRNFTPRMQAAFQRNSALQLLQYNAADRRDVRLSLGVREAGHPDSTGVGPRCLDRLY